MARVAQCMIWRSHREYFVIDKCNNLGHKARTCTRNCNIIECSKNHEACDGNLRQMFNSQPGTKSTCSTRGFQKNFLNRHLSHQKSCVFTVQQGTFRYQTDLIFGWFTWTNSKDVLRSMLANYQLMFHFKEGCFRYNCNKLVHYSGHLSNILHTTIHIVITT